MADTQQQWNPVDEARKNYPALKDWSDDRILENLSDPTKFKSAFPQYAHLGDDVIKKNIGALRASKKDFTSNPDKEGLYTLYGMNPTKENPNAVGTVQVPYSKVQNALQSGYTFYENSGDQYAKDAEAAGKTPSWLGTMGERVQQFLQPTEGAKGSLPVPGTGLDVNTAKAVGRTVAATPAFLRDLAKAAIQDHETGSTDVMKMLDPGNIPLGLQQQFSEDMEKSPTLALQNLEGSLVGMGLVGAATHGATELASTGIRNAVENTPNRIRDRFSGGTVRNLIEGAKKKNLAEESKAATLNTENAAAHLEKSQDAAHETAGAEIGHQYTETEAQKELDERNRVAREEHNKNELDRIDAEGKKRLDALYKNKKNINNYESEVQRVREENNTLRRQELARQRLDTRLDRESQVLEDKYDQTFKKARTDYNQTWNKWRDAVKDVQADMNPVVGVVKSQESSMNPQQVSQFREILRETAPGPEDLTEYQQTRNSVMKNLGYKGEYEQLSPLAKTSIDDMMKAIGMEETVQAGYKSVPAERLHTWKSQLERAVRNTQDGTIRYAIGKVLDQVRASEATASEQAGPDAVKQLMKARSITGPYFDAFFRSPEDLPKAAAQSLREQSPEYVREQARQERVNRIAAYDPTVARQARLVSNLRTASNNLRQAMGRNPEPTPIPRPPAGAVMTPIGPVIDLRNPNLPPKPAPPAEFIPKTRNPGAAPVRNLGPDRPPIVEPDYTKVGENEVREAKKETLRKTADWMRHRANWIASGLILSHIPFDILHGNVTAAADEVLYSGMAYMITGKIGDFLENPRVEEWLTKPTAKDVKAILDLPPAQRGELSQAWGPIVKEAQSHGIKVLPALATAITGESAARQKREKKEDANSPKALMQQAQDLQKQFANSGYSR